MNIFSVEATKKTGKENFSYEGKIYDFSLQDFWSWNNSNLLNNALRGKLAEYIIMKALDIEQDFRLERDDYDVNYKGLRIEIKSWAYIQSWEQRKFSNIIFWIRPTQAEKWEDKKRQSDVYVFCLLKHKEASSIDPLKLEQRTFYILPTSILDEKVGEQKTISLQSLLKLMPKESNFIDLKGYLDEFF